MNTCKTKELPTAQREMSHAMSIQPAGFNSGTANSPAENCCLWGNVSQIGRKDTTEDSLYPQQLPACTDWVCNAIRNADNAKQY